MLAWRQSIGKQHGVIVVNIHFYTADGIRGMRDKLIMDCERGGNSKKNNSSDGSYSMKVKCLFMLRSMPSGSDWKVMVKCEFHNHKLAKDLNDYDILGRLKNDDERQFVNDTTKYILAPRYIIVAL